VSPVISESKENPRDVTGQVPLNYSCEYNYELQGSTKIRKFFD
jgi:hypothetical protein